MGDFSAPWARRPLLIVSRYRISEAAHDATGERTRWPCATDLGVTAGASARPSRCSQARKEAALNLLQLARELRDPQARFAMLLELADAFSRRPRRSWGYSPEQIELGRRLMPIVTTGAAGPWFPDALAQWYFAVGRVPELTSIHNRLLPPDDLELKDDVLIVYVENQSCAFWGIQTEALMQDDPPIVVGDMGDWWCESDTLSKFAL